MFGNQYGLCLTSVSTKQQLTASVYKCKFKISAKLDLSADVCRLQSRTTKTSFKVTMVTFATF